MQFPNARRYATVLTFELTWFLQTNASTLMANSLCGSYICSKDVTGSFGFLFQDEKSGKKAL